MTNALHIKAPAKINRFLHVVGQRKDGYHLLQSVFQLIDLHDDIYLTASTDGLVHRPTGAVNVPPEEDLVVRAAKLLQEYSQTKQGCTIQVEKRIPMGAGLGGGSSDAAATLWGLNELWGLQLSRKELMNLGVKLGADVPFFLFGQNAFVWVGTADGFVSLRLRKGLLTLSEQEITQWIDSLPVVHRAAAACLSPVELSWLMSVNERELLHWLYPQQWDLNEPWPLAKPDGSAMGVGTELDRMFRIVAAGQVAMF